MKVLLANVCCKEGSTGKIVYDLYHGLRKDGHEAVIAYGRGRKINEPGIHRVGIPAETYIHAGLTRLTGYTGCFSPISTRRMIRLIDEFRPDVINLHEMHAYFMNIRPLVRHIRKKGIPTVWTFHCEEMYTGKCGHAYNCTRYKDGCGKCPAVHDYPKSLWLDQTHKIWQRNKDLFDGWDVTIVTPSQWLADRVKGSFLADKRIEVIHNGIDTEHIFYPHDATTLREQYGLTGKKVVLAVMPNIHDERKGGPVVLALATQMPDLQFVIVGADETENYSDNVLLVKRMQDQQELATWYSLADVFLLTSQKETFSMTCAEALCCGAPVAGLESGAPETVFPQPYARFVGDNPLIGDISAPPPMDNTFAPSAVAYTRLATAVGEQLAAGYDHSAVSAAMSPLFADHNMYQHYRDLYRELCQQ